MRILISQIDPAIGDIQGNTQKILNAINIAREKRASLVIFPELSLCGYPPEDFLLLPSFIDDVEKALNHIMEATDGIAAIVGVCRKNPSPGEKGLCNSAAVIENGKLIGFHDKMLLPTYDVFDERRFFEPGRTIHLWKIAGHDVGITICEDIWQHSELVKYTTYQRDPIQELCQMHPELVVNLSASPYSLSKFTNRLKACERAAKTLKCPLLLANQVGGNDSLIFDGYSLYISGQGTLLDLAKGFEEDQLFVDLNANQLPKKFTRDPLEDLYHALVLGIRDYFHKLGFSSACIGLSGGIDSALVACLAVDALGKDNVLGLLMPSRYTSPQSITDALQLVKTLGIKTHQISIEGPFESYLQLLKPIFSPRPPDVTEENIQARIRGMILMAMSNKFGCLVLSTGNKSELAMGYSTLYGDMCGGLAVISDVTKQQVYALSRWINRDAEIIPWSSIHKPPSAELRPNQKDTDSLPDYEVVDNILQAYIEEHLSPEAISKKFGYRLELVDDLIRRIHRNEYKRRQSPPGLRVSEKAFSIGRRFPIVQRYVD